MSTTGDAELAQLREALRKEMTGGCDCPDDATHVGEPGSTVALWVTKCEHLLCQYCKDNCVCCEGERVNPMVNPAHYRRLRP